MELTDLQRLKKIIKWLIFSDFGDNEKEIAAILGYKKSSFSQILNGRVPISDKFIEKIISLDKNINKVWIKKGEGSMLKTEISPAPVQELQPANNPLLEQENIFLKEKIALLEENKALQECKETLYKDKIASLQREIKRLEQEIADLKKEPKSTIPTAFVVK